MEKFKYKKHSMNILAITYLSGYICRMVYEHLGKKAP